MNLGLQRKVIIVTGGAKGIGRAIVESIAAEGGIPVIADRDEQAATELFVELTRRGTNAFSVATDLRKAENCLSIIEATNVRYGRIHGIVNNAGVNDGVGLENGSPQAFQASLEKNLHHYYAMAHYGLPYLKESQGNIVNISSKTAVTGQGGTSGYVAAKGGILGLTREWAAELTKYKIRVNAVLPAEVMTPLYENWLQSFEDPEAQKAAIEQRIPLEKRMTNASEIANAVVFLLSERASHITGQHWHVDGGYVHLDRALE